jgi:putative inorganic carbon (hco3(-)) transporter
VGFVLFLVLNAILFLRPEELLPSITGLKIYYWVICANLIICAPAIVNQFRMKALARSPVTVCVLGVLATIFTSHLARLDFWNARAGMVEFLKVVLYFLLLMSVVTTKRRLLWFLAAIVAFTLVINVLAVLQYQGQINIKALTVLMELDYDEATGERFQIPRMLATGIFNDPNDLSMIVVAGIMICGAGLYLPQLGSVRWALAVPIGFLLYALTLTQSRGGLLALLAGFGTVVYFQYGWQKALLAGSAAVPGLLALGGRQADLGGAMSGGTAESRTELWSESLQLFKQSPLFGIGYNGYGEIPMQVAHNSFVHTTTELGFFGGMFFLGVFAISALALWQLSTRRRQIADPTLRRLFPFMCALLVAYGVSMFSLSRCYVVPTYLIAGLVASYLRMAAPQAAFKLPTLSGKLLQRLATAEAAMIAVTYLFVKVAVRL